MSSDSEKTIVVIGDWFIDENWLVSRQKLYHSSHTGDIHFQARHKELDKRIISLCGAAELLEVLRSYLHDEKNPKNDKFLGFGMWNQIDNDILKCILCEHNPEHKLLTPFTLKSFEPSWYAKIEKREEGRCIYKDKECMMNPVNLFNFADQLKDSYNDVRFSTNRVIRCYEGFGGGEPHLLYRFDWILPIHQEAIKYKELFEKEIKNTNVSTVLIEDHGLGVVNEECIKALIQNVDKVKTKWFIRTKIKNPSWMKVLKDKGIAPNLLVVDFRLANYEKGERRWFNDKELGRASLELLGQMTGVPSFEEGEWKNNYEFPKSESATVLLENNMVFAKKCDYCFGIHQPPGRRQIINIGRTTVFYAALIAQYLQNEEMDFFTQCQNALECAFNWTKGASDLWYEEEKLHFYGNYSEALKNLNSNNTSTENHKINTRNQIYFNEWQMWNNSSSGLGVVNPKPMLDNRTTIQFCASEINDPVGLFKKLDDNNSSLSQFVKRKLSQDPKEILNNYDNTYDKFLEIQEIMARELNNVLKSKDLYTKKRFEKIPLSVEAKALLNKPEVKNYRDLNKLLIRDAYNQFLTIDKEKLQLWRGEGTLPGYICVGGPKRDAINQLVTTVANFNNNRYPKHPLSCLLTASPGWGKSYLAKSLAKYFNMEFLEFSIAELSTSRDLIDCLASIASSQNRIQKKTLVFIDEVNAKIEGHDVLSLLLSPLWDGKFNMDGKTFSLTPGVWIFASTDPMSIIDEEIRKGSDFVSRLNGPILELDMLGAERKNYLPKAINEVRKIVNENAGKEFEDYIKKIYECNYYKSFIDDTEAQLKTEQVYMMSSLLISHWGPLSMIQKGVLHLFHDLLAVNGFRSLEFFASQFEEVREGRITISNVPRIKNNEALMRHIILPIEWLHLYLEAQDSKEIKLKELNNLKIKEYKDNEYVKIETII